MCHRMVPHSQLYLAPFLLRLRQVKSMGHRSNSRFHFCRSLPFRAICKTSLRPYTSLHSSYGGPASPDFGRGAGQVFAEVGGGFPMKTGEEQQPKQCPYIYYLLHLLLPIMGNSAAWPDSNRRRQVYKLLRSPTELQRR